MADIVQALWLVEGSPGEAIQIQPDICTDFIALDHDVDRVLMNGPMLESQATTLEQARTYGLRFVPGVLPSIGPGFHLSHLKDRDEIINGPKDGAAPWVQLQNMVRSMQRTGRIERDEVVDEVLALMDEGKYEHTGNEQVERLFEVFVGLTPDEAVSVIEAAAELDVREPDHSATNILHFTAPKD